MMDHDGLVMSGDGLAGSHPSIPWIEDQKQLGVAFSLAPSPTRWRSSRPRSRLVALHQEGDVRVTLIAVEPRQALHHLIRA